VTPGRWDCTRPRHADKKTINAFEHGKLLIIAKVGKLLPGPNPKADGAKGGRGRKGSSDAELPFCKETRAAYRKIGAHEKRIEEYLQCVQDRVERTQGCG
jgi:hypothetical protein